MTVSITAVDILQRLEEEEPQLRERSATLFLARKCAFFSKRYLFRLASNQKHANAVKRDVFLRVQIKRFGQGEKHSNVYSRPCCAPVEARLAVPRQVLHRQQTRTAIMSTFKWMGGARLGRVKKSQRDSAQDAQRSFFAQARSHLTPAFSSTKAVCQASLTPGLHLRKVWLCKFWSSKLSLRAGSLSDQALQARERARAA